MLRWRIFGLLFIAIVVTIAVGVGLFFHIRHFHDLYQSSWWPTATAEVVRTNIVHTPASRGRRRSTPEHFDATVEYKFLVDRHPYFSHFSPRYYTKAEADGFAAQHPVGRQLTVFYDPADPTRALVNSGLTEVEFAVMLFFAPGVLAVAACWAAPIARLHRRPPRFIRDVRIDEGPPIRARRLGLGPVAGGLWIAFGLSFVPAIAAYVFGWATSELHVVLVYLADAACAGAAIAWCIWSDRRSGNVLVIDHAEGVLVTPDDCGGDALNLKSIGGTTIRHTTQWVESGKWYIPDSKRYHYHVYVTPSPGSKDVWPVMYFKGDEDGAHEFDAWLRTQLKFPPRRKA